MEHQAHPSASYTGDSSLQTLRPRFLTQAISARQATQALKALTALTMALCLMLMGQAEAFAQQMAYVPNQPTGYGQPVYNQQPYYGQPTYQQPSYPQQQAYPQQNYGQTQPMAQGLAAPQIEQLVAPIALYPDTLVAQILAASTYPAQVVEADRWRQAQGYSTADQIAAGANVQPWDPSVKALTAFPQVLGELDQNIRWTTELGAAYYNQPQDLFQAVQVLRQRAQTAGTLQNTPQEAVSYNQGNIILAPVDPQVIYVPSYNPWTAYGAPVTPFPGFSLLSAIGSFVSSALGSSPLRFSIGTIMTAFSGMSWGWVGWAVDWLVHAIFFHHSNYYTHSTTVADWGLPHGGPRAYGFHEGFNTDRGGYYHAANAYSRSGGYSGASGFTRAPAYSYNRPGDTYNRGYQSPGNSFNRTEAFNRTAQMPGRTQQYGGFGSNNFNNRPDTARGNTQQTYRAPASDFGRSNSNSLMSRNDTKSFEKQQHDFEKQQHNQMKSFEKQQRSFNGGGSHAPKSFSSHNSGGGHSSGGKHHFL